MRRRWTTVILTVAGVIFFLAGCKQNVGTPEDNAVVEEPEETAEEAAEEWLAGFSCPDLEEPFYKALKESVKAALEEQGDEILVQSAGGDVQQQNAQIEEMIASGIAALFLWPADPEEITPALEALDKADVPVINLGTMVAETDLTEAYIGLDDRNAGKVCAEDLTERKPDGGSMVIIESPDQISFNERITGFEESLVNSGFEVVTRINGSGDAGGVKAQMLQVLSETRKLDAVMCASDCMAVQVLEALAEAGRRDVLVYSVGGSPEVKGEMAEGGSPMTGIGALSPINMGKAAVSTAAAVLDGEDFEKEVYVETFFINRDNLNIYGTDGWQ